MQWRTLTPAERIARVIAVEDRAALQGAFDLKEAGRHSARADDYLTALDRVSIDKDIGPFAGFMAERVRWSMEKVAG